MMNIIKIKSREFEIGCSSANENDFVDESLPFIVNEFINNYKCDINEHSWILVADLEYDIFDIEFNDNIIKSLEKFINLKFEQKKD